MVIDRKRSLIFAGLFIGILIVLFIIVQTFLNRGNTLKLSYKYVKEVGTVQKISKKTKGLAVHVEYPVFGIEKIDDIITDRIHGIIFAFEGNSNGVWKSLKVDYNSYLLEDNKASVDIVVAKGDETGNTITVKHYPLTFDMTSGKVVSVGDIYDGAGLEALSLATSKANMILGKAAKMADFTASNDFSKDGIGSIKRFSMSRDNVNFYSADSSRMLSVSVSEVESIAGDENLMKTMRAQLSKNTGGRLASINKKKPVVAITFDDGPSRELTPKLLKMLKKQDAVATFFMLGSKIENNEDIVKEMYDNGNEIGNHTWKHDLLTRMSKSQVRADLSRTNKALEKAIGQKASVFRPSYGAYNQNVRSVATEPIIMWSVDPMDWKFRNAARVSNHIISNARDGDIILLHDIHPTSVKAAEIVVKKLKAKGYQFVTVSELAALRKTKLINGKSYSQINKK